MLRALGFGGGGDGANESTPPCTPPRKGKTNVSSTAKTDGLQSLHSNLFVPSRVVKTDIVLPPRKGEDGEENVKPLAFSLDNVFTKLECRELIRLTEALGYGAALINVGGGRQALISDVRDSTRCMVDDPVVAALLFERIAAFLPAQWRTRNHRWDESVPPFSRLVGLNERLRFLRYEKGQKFAPHFDGTYQRPMTPESPFPERSYITVQLYLNDGGGGDDGSSQPEFGGGSTAFIDEQAARPAGQKSGDAALEEHVLHHCHPRAGRVLVFEHHLLHQGSPITGFGIKYCLRTDAMYQPDASIKQLQQQQQQEQQQPNAANGAAAAAAAAAAAS